MHFTHVAPPERVGSRASVEVESRWRDSASYEPSQGCHKGCSSLVTHQKHFEPTQAWTGRMVTNVFGFCVTPPATCEASIPATRWPHFRRRDQPGNPGWIGDVSSPNLTRYPRPVPEDSSPVRSRSPRINPSTAGDGATRCRHSAIRPRDRAAMARPASAALTVGGLIPASLARSLADHPLRASSSLSLPG